LGVGNGKYGLEAVDHQWPLQGSPVAEWQLLKHSIDRACMEVQMPVQAGAKAVDESDCFNVQRCLVHLGRFRAVVLQALRNAPQR
jgi:hypothetical protein